MTVNFKIYKLHFATPLHLGDERKDYSISLKTLRSDAMYAALTNALAKIGMDLPEDGDLGFSISSLFPFYQKNKESNYVLFFPKLLKQTIIDKKYLDHAKEIKKISWLDLNYFNKHILGENIFDDINFDHVKGEFLSRENIDSSFISTQISPRVTISRSGEKDAEPFYMDRVFFKDYSGLYFIAIGDTTKLDIALEVLQHEGVGTDRNVGNGFFSFVTDEFELELPESNYAATLSMFCPSSREQLEKLISDNGQDVKIAYDFIPRGGWITDAKYNNFRKNTIHMFTEASIFKNEKKNNAFTLGKIVDLKPDIEFNPVMHPVWRNGKAIFIPVIPV